MKEQLIPVTPAPPGSQVAKEGQALLQPNFCMAVISILMLKLEVTEVSISQDEFNQVTGLVLLEGRDKDNNFCLGLGFKKGGTPS